MEVVLKAVLKVVRKVVHLHAKSRDEAFCTRDPLGATALI